jgi:hypothetical protein
MVTSSSRLKTIKNLHVVKLIELYGSFSMLIKMFWTVVSQLYHKMSVDMAAPRETPRVPTWLRLPWSEISRILLSVHARKGHWAYKTCFTSTRGVLPNPNKNMACRWPVRINCESFEIFKTISYTWNEKTWAELVGFFLSPCNYL